MRAAVQCSAVQYLGRISSSRLIKAELIINPQISIDVFHLEESQVKMTKKKKREKRREIGRRNKKKV
jgi:hypothetical protein